MNVLIADIGGTNARFAISPKPGSLHGTKVLASADFPTIAKAIGAYVEDLKPADKPSRARLAVACTVAGDKVEMTNHHWSFSTKELCFELAMDGIEVINDFAAIALGVPGLGEQDRIQVGGGRPVGEAPIIVLGPGTGLGVSALVPSPGGWIPLATEGGHATLAAFDESESAVVSILRRTVPDDSKSHVSAERVLSGPGSLNLYKALCELEGQAPAPDADPASITAMALDGSCPIAAKAQGMFLAMLGTFASNLCLSLGARGGVYIAGGIIPKMVDAIANSEFRQRFEAKGRFSGYLSSVPTYVITHPHPALAGLAGLAG